MSETMNQGSQQGNKTTKSVPENQVVKHGYEKTQSNQVIEAIQSTTVVPQNQVIAATQPVKTDNTAIVSNFNNSQKQPSQENLLQTINELVNQMKSGNNLKLEISPQGKLIELLSFNVITQGNLMSSITNIVNGRQQPQS